MPATLETDDLIEIEFAFASSLARRLPTSA